MKPEDVYWGGIPWNKEHQWRHAYFRDANGIASGVIAKSIQGFYRMSPGERNQHDMTPLEFKCWLLDKEQVPPP